MGIFNFLKKSQEEIKPSMDPYRDPATNIIYNLLFCDNVELFKAHMSAPYSYPFDILFSESSTVNELQKITDDVASEPRIKMLAYNKQMATGHKPQKKELLAVIVEIGLDNGLDVLAAFSNGTTRYINQTGKIAVWETNDPTSDQLISHLFSKSVDVVNQIGPWNKPRLPHPIKGNVRISFLVSDGLYFGEGPVDVLFNDPMGAPALSAATDLLKYITSKVTAKS